MTTSKPEGIQVIPNTNIHTTEIRAEDDKNHHLRITLGNGAKIDLPPGQGIKVEQVWCG